MKFTTRGLVQTGLLLAVCIASQFFKNLSVYLTGPIVNTTIILAVLAVGLWSGILTVSYTHLRPRDRSVSRMPSSA